MLLRHLFAVVGVAALFAMSSGCSSYYKDINDVTGVTEEELKKSMEGSSEGLSVVQTTAEETMELLLDPEVSESAAEALKSHKRRLTGKVLETSPAGSDSQFVILDGGTHNNQACKIKCLLAKDQAEALQDVKVGDEIRITGSSDAVVTKGVLELKDCVFDSASPSKSSGFQTLTDASIR